MTMWETPPGTIRGPSLKSGGRGSGGSKTRQFRGLGLKPRAGGVGRRELPLLCPGARISVKRPSIAASSLGSLMVEVEVTEARNRVGVLM